MERNKWIHIRVTDSERQAWQAIAQVNNLTLADLIRQQIGDIKPNRRPTKRRARLCQQADPALTREITRIGNNCNQIARWANTYKRAAEAVPVCAHLVVIQRQLTELLKQQPSSRQTTDSIGQTPTPVATETPSGYNYAD